MSNFVRISPSSPASTRMYNQNFNASRRYSGNRGNFTRQPRSGAYERKEPSLEQLLGGLGSKIEAIKVPLSGAGGSDVVSIEDFKAVASYSWTDDSSPTIIVPGSPPIWRERTMPFSVNRDTDTVFIDQNASRVSSSPLLPLIAAVSHHAPDFLLSSVDFVTDRNGLRKLWRWAAGDPKADTFRIDVDLVGTKTILMQRWEAETTQPGGPGYERNFEKASTIPGTGCEMATGHHRIVTYDLGGLKILLRFKADACVQTPVRNTPKLMSKPDPLDELTSGLQRLTVAKFPETITSITTGGAPLSILTRGTLVPQSALLELKTRSFRSVNQFDWDDTYTQLFLSRTPNIFLCVHQTGTFQEVRKRTLAELETQVMARKAYEGLRKLRDILKGVQDILKEEGEGARLSLVCRHGAEIVVYERKSKDGLLPKEILRKFKE
ncbi:hypothetical protein K439DRAFT_1415180 [Ramaria rubella]|nr:hypothetical protein K439DRAFT_1415180 [Ramaria rubella]